MILKELEQAQASAAASPDPFVSDATDTCQHCVALWRAFVGAFNATKAARVAGDASMEAAFLLNSWRGNPFAEAFAATFAEDAERRVAVPDPFFVHQEDEAPALVPIPGILLPDGLPQTLQQANAEQWMARQMTASCRQTAQRLGVVPIGAVLISDQPVATLARHLLALGMQPSPTGGATVFRYQDPAVMQLLWPVLDDEQHAAWMGPVHQWWSLRQYWQPWDLRNPPQCEADWWQGRAPDAPRSPTARRPLGLTAAQWHRAAFHRSAQESWMDLFIEAPDVSDMPDGPRMLRMLVDGVQLGLTSNEALKDYVWLTWRGANDGAPVDWTLDPFRERLTAALARLRGQPGSVLSSAYHEIVQPTITP